MKSMKQKRIFSFVVVMVLTLSIISSNLVFNVFAAGNNNNWEVGGTGQNVTLSTSGSATAINFAPSYNWSTEWAQLPNKVAPIDTGTFAFKFAVHSLAGGWIPFVLCWAANAAGSLNTNGLTFLVTGNNLGIFNTSSGSYFAAPLLANVPINTSPNMCYPVTEQLEQEQMLL